MRRNKLLFLPALLFLVLAACSPQSPEKPLVILQTSDVHGAILPVDFIRESPAPTSLAQVYTYVQQQRKDHALVLLDNGDILQGQPLVYYSNFVDTARMHICADVMNFMGVDAATVGNHDIEAGPSVYHRLVHEFQFPWMAANVTLETTGEPAFKPYTLIRKDGWKIAVLGLTTPWVPRWLPRRLWEGMAFGDMLAAAREWVPRILEKEKPDLMIGLFHSGTGSGEEGELAENTGRLIAEQVPGFDVVFTGHDHRPALVKVRNTAGDSVLILNPGSQASFVARVRASFRDGKLVLEPALVPMQEEPADSVFMARYAPWQKEVEAYLDQPVGRLSHPVYARDALFGDAAFTDLIHRIQLDITGADLSFTAPLSMQAAVPSGELTVRNLFALYRFENFLYSMRLSGEEIRKYLEYSYAGWFEGMEKGNTHILRFRKDQDGNPLYNERYGSYQLEEPVYNFDSAEGIDYVVDLSAPAGSRVKIQGFSDGRRFDPGSSYLVAVNSYRGSGGGGHLTRGAGIPADSLPGRIIQSTDRDLRYYMAGWFRQQDEVTPRVTGNWTVLPLPWAEKARERDYQLMFPDVKMADSLKVF